MVLKSLQTELSVRGAEPDDRIQLNNLFHFEPYVHRHLDWKRPLDWLGHTPYLVIERKNRLIAALACPMDPPGVAWIRVFACSREIRPNTAWNLLWEAARRELSPYPDVEIATLCPENWMQRLVEDSGFIHTHNVVLLSWERRNQKLPEPAFQGRLRKMRQNDLPEVLAIDNASFDPLWCNSFSSLQIALAQSAFASVAVQDSRILGYQISTPNPLGGHLARLAVRPEERGKGIGYALVHHVLTQFQHQGVLRVTVNTQDNNTASLALYAKARFRRTNSVFPVYQYDL